MRARNSDYFETYLDNVTEKKNAIIGCHKRAQKTMKA